LQKHCASSVLTAVIEGRNKSNLDLPRVAANMGGGKYVALTGNIFLVNSKNHSCGSEKNMKPTRRLIQTDLLINDSSPMESSHDFHELKVSII
jgi:hypothetical protein